nr:hypothetical protein [uncultured Lichenicoccus sp.]
MAADIARHLAAASRMTDDHRVAQLKPRDQLGKIIGILVHVVVVPGLVRPAMAAPVRGMTR